MSLSSVLGIAGNFLGGPLGGFIGSTIGMLLRRPDDIVNYGPRLQDRRVITTGYGQGLPIIYGKMQAAGHVIEPKNFHLTETVHESEESGGKGGPTVTNVRYTYSATFAMLLCEGPIIGVRRIWFDAELVYDFSTSTTAAAIVASNNAASGIRIYTGSETQLPDSILDSINGVGNTPAYRGSAYLLFSALQTEKYGNHLPNIRAEIVGSGSKATAGFMSYVGDHPYSYQKDFYNAAIITGIDNGVIRIWDNVETEAFGGDVGNIHLVDLNGNYLGNEPAPLEIDRIVSQDNAPPFIDNYWYRCGTLGTGISSQFVYAQNFKGYLPEPAGTFKLQILSTGIGGTLYGHNFAADLPQDRYPLGWAFSADHKRMIIIMGDVGVSPGSTQASGVWYMYDDNTDLVDSGTCDFSGTDIGGVNYNHIGHGNFAHDPIIGQGSATTSALESDYKHFWTNYRGLSFDLFKINDSGVLEFQEEINDTFNTPSGAHDRHSTFADNGVVAQMYHDYTGGDFDNGVAVFSREKLYTTTSATLSDIVDDIEERAGVTSDNRDNSALTDLVDGYMISRPTVARKAIEPLQTAFFFDATETGFKIKSEKRGSVSVATIDIAEMGAVSYGSEPIHPLKKTRLQETELPLQVICQYINASRGYEISTQRSSRIASQSFEKKNIDLPISMSELHHAFANRSS